MSDKSGIRVEFERAAAGFAERTKGRFDDLGVVAFSRVESGATVLEVGAGTGNFLQLFSDVAAGLIALDLTPGMLAQARARYPEIDLLVGDGSALPLRARSIDLVTSAQMFHHVFEPVPILKEMGRVAAPGGRVLVVDQASTERFEEIQARHELELARDPTHAATRPPSAFRIMFGAAGLDIVDERIVESEQRLSKWMWPGEFPEERITAVRAFIEERGHETGMGFERDDDDWVFLRRRMMLLATPT